MKAAANHTTAWRGLKWSLSLFLLFITSLHAKTGKIGGLEQLLDAAAVNVPGLEKITMDVDVLIYSPDEKGGWNQVPVQKSEFKYRRNGTLLESEEKRLCPNKEGLLEYDGFEYKIVYNANQCLSRQRSGGKVLGHVSKKGDVKKSVHSTDSGNVLDGYFPHNRQHYVDLFKELPGHVSLRPAKEMMGSYSCDVIEANTPAGRYTLWIDAMNGHCIRRAEVAAEPNDTAFGAPLHQRSRSLSCTEPKRLYYRQMRWEVKDVEVTQIGRTFLPVSGTLIEDSFYEDGSKTKVKYVFQRKNINLNPDFEALGAFKMDMTDGTVVYDLDSIDGRYLWKNGELTPYVKKQAKKEK